MTEENNNQWQLAEFNNLKVIGMFNGKVTKKSLNYPSIRTDYIISPLMLLQDYEKGRIKGMYTYKKTRFVLQILYLNA